MAQNGGLVIHVQSQLREDGMHGVSCPWLGQHLLLVIPNASNSRPTSLSIAS